jgi:hypothetical protein
MGDTQTHRQDGDRISILQENRLKRIIVAYHHYRVFSLFFTATNLWTSGSRDNRWLFNVNP